MNSRYYHYYYHFLETTYTRPKRTTIRCVGKYVIVSQSLYKGFLVFQNFELTKHRLIYEGALTWRTKGQKNVDLHVVLLEEYILLLQKQDDKYVLKFHSINYLNSKEESKCTHRPIIKIATVLVRPVATGEIIILQS